MHSEIGEIRQIAVSPWFMTILTHDGKIFLMSPEYSTVKDKDELRVAKKDDNSPMVVKYEINDYQLRDGSLITKVKDIWMTETVNYKNRFNLIEVETSFG